MNNHETINNSQQQKWDLSDVPFAGAEKQSDREKIHEALRGTSNFLAKSAAFGEDYAGNNRFINAILDDSNDEIINNIKELDNGRYKVNYGTDDLGKGFTGLGQASGALDYFDEEYGQVIDDDKTKGFIKTCIAMWPMGNVGSFGVHEFAKSAKIDEGTAKLVNMVIDRNSMKLVDARFNNGSEDAGEKLIEVNKKYLERLDGGVPSYNAGYMATRICNIQKIVMDCEKVGAEIAKERKASN